ncbi:MULTISPECIES: hypothetical protein [unclassified Nocardioides]|uniref:hypothetical protein n=1 Tax=unclassified Nocardioides TaxID=2615069 RepID=UPI001055D0AE|nr:MULTISPECIES: hypothetical protein [unclassified Nocardioides]
MSEAAHHPRPEAMRDLVRAYVATVHTTYLDHSAHLAPGTRATLPLVAAGEVTVVVAAAQRLHLIATTDPLPAPQGPEVELRDEHRGTRWTVRFFDPSVLPPLGLLLEDTPADVRRVLGIADTVYHLTVAVGGGLTGHHAQHTGVALANQHAKALRDLERLRVALPRQERTVDELGDCTRLGLDRAAALLAAELTSGRVAPEPGTPAASCLAAVLDDVKR